MQVGWQGIARTIAVTTAVTSAFWVVLGSWLFNRYLDDQFEGGASAHFADSREDRVGPGAARSAQNQPAMVMPVGSSATLEVIPVSGVAANQLTDTFTQARDEGVRRHDAIDIPAPSGTPVVAAMAGRVEKLWRSEAGGNTVYIRSSDLRTITYYAHLDSYAPGLAEGQVLAAGAPLGFVGRSGNADPAAPHLHFAVLQTAPDRKWSDPATPVNPYPLLTARRFAARQAAVGR